MTLSIAASVDLARLNTLQLMSRAEHAARLTSIEDVQHALAVCDERGWPIEILGGGSNVVLKDHVPGCLLLPELRWIAREDRGDRVRVRAGAGVVWHDLVRYCIGQGLYGIENLALIPGRVGAAPIQNIGAYGVELESRFVELRAVSCRDGTVRVFDRGACAFAYRDSAFRGAQAERFLIVEVCLELSHRFAALTDYPDIRVELSRLPGPLDACRLAEAVTRVRRRKLPDPARVPNAGSFFKNPVITARDFDVLVGRIGPVQGFAAPVGVKVSAAKLIDACGWKGRTLGRAGVWYRQPLVLVNRGGASARDVLNLADAIIEDVGSRLGIALELEPQILGVDRAGAH